MNTKLTIAALKEVDLNEVESKLLKVNIELLKAKYISVKKCGIDGIQRLAYQVNFRLGLFKIRS